MQIPIGEIRNYISCDRTSVNCHLFHAAASVIRILYLNLIMSVSKLAYN